MFNINLSELQRQSIETAIRLNLTLRGNKLWCPKIVPSLQHKKNVYDILFWGADEQSLPIVPFNANVLTHMQIQLFAEHAVNACYRAKGDLVDTIADEILAIPKNEEYIPAHLFLEAINTEMNQDLLRLVPSTKLLDLSFVCRLEFSELVKSGCNEYRSVIIDYPLMKILNYTEEQLFFEAKQCKLNTYRAVPFDLSTRKDSVYFIRNKHGLYGASAIGSIDALLILANTLQKDLVIIPESIHQLYAFPYEEDAVDALKALSLALCADVESPDEFLSERAYLLCREDKNISIL